MAGKAKKITKKMPVGMLIIAVFLIVAAVSSLFALVPITPPAVFLLGIYLTGIIAYIFQVISLILIILIIVGIFKRYKWVWLLALIYFGFFIMSLSISLAVFFISPESMIHLMTQNIPSTEELSGVSMESFVLITFVTTAIISLILYIIIFIYVFKKKDFFQ
jgi:hypothetical protein